MLSVRAHAANEETFHASLKWLQNTPQNKQFIGPYLQTHKSMRIGTVTRLNV